MTIIRQPRLNKFTVINNELIDDDRLSMKSLSVLVYVLSKPDNWQTKTHQLCERFQCGEKAMLSALKEIELAGYLRRIRHRDARGAFQWTHIISDTSSIPPLSTHGLSTHGLSTHGLSTHGKPADITNTDSTITELTITELTNEEPHVEIFQDKASQEDSVSLLIPDPKEKKGSAENFEPFRLAYNENRPRFWPEMQVVNPRRQKLLKELIRDCHGAQPAIAALTNALKYAQGDSWYSSKSLNFENFASNGKILQLHERYVGQFDSGVAPELDTQSNRKTATEAERLKKILEAKYGSN